MTIHIVNFIDTLWRTQQDFGQVLRQPNITFKHQQQQQQHMIKGTSDIKLNSLLCINKYSTLYKVILICLNKKWFQ
jgi:hypothetical protein